MKWMGFLTVFFLSICCFSCLSKDYAQNHCVDCHRVHHKKKGDCYLCHQGFFLSKNREVAHRTLIPAGFACFRFKKHPKIKRGRRLVKDLGCRRCHVIEGRGNLLAKNLDRVSFPVDVGALVSAIKEPFYYMPEFCISTKEIEAVVSYILYSASRSKRKRFRTYRVHFKNFLKDVFDRRCGDCHKVLTKRFGGLGKGDVGPNLSGIFTLYYPRSSFIFSCSEEKLKKWLKNPRELKPYAIMPPVVLDSKEMEALLRILKD